MAKMTLSEELTWRGFVHQTTLKSITELDAKPVTFYWGVDPSAQSMTIGNLAAAMLVRHLIDHGHKAVLLVGGATGMIGDPDGKAEERSLKTFEELAANKQALAKQYQKVFDGQEFQLVDNYDWFKGLEYLEFLRQLGKHVPMRQMLARDFVQKRLADDGPGISYAEFSYVLIQAYDYLYMNREMNVSLQVCGSDQWGNSIAGVDLIRRITGNVAHVLSSPLIVNKSTGVKFGKTEKGAIWLDETLTSVFSFYQFWLNLDDDGVEGYLKIYTMLNRDELESLMAEFVSDPASRLAQKTLAYEVTKLVHGDERAGSARRTTEVLFGSGNYGELEATDMERLVAELPIVQVKSDSILDILTESGLAASRSEARRHIEQQSISINGQAVGLEQKVDTINFLHGYAVIRKGKNSFALLKPAV